MKGKRVGEWLLLAIILVLGLMFRLLFFERSFFFAHDQDLYSWIAKDILSGHQRLVGQITSVDGVFIGSFYYYLIAIGYKIFGMNPLSAVGPIVLFSLINILSIYWMMRRYWSKQSALVASFIYAVAFGIARFDRWSVPTLPTLTWSIWFLVVNFELLRGNLKFLPLYGFLVGFVWQLHIALLPILPLPILAYLFGKNNLIRLVDKQNVVYTGMGILVFLSVISPFLLFEVKHNWSQVRAMVASTQKSIGAPTGKMKLVKVIEASGREFQQRIVFGLKYESNYIYWIVFGAMSFWLMIHKILKKEEVLIILLWVFLICLAQFISKRVVSEYYFTNLLPLFLIILALFLANFVRYTYLWVLLALFLLLNSYWLVTRTDEDQSYLYRRQVVEYIKKDVVENNYPCIAINFIADPGVGVGFRYLSWYYGINLVKPGSPGVPVYNIPIPWQLSRDENPAHFGRFGVLLPRPVEKLVESKDCNKPEYQLDPLLGYTE